MYEIESEPYIYDRDDTSTCPPRNLPSIGSSVGKGKKRMGFHIVIQRNEPCGTRRRKEDEYNTNIPGYLIIHPRQYNLGE